jgi:DNA replication protein DnaC
MYRAGRHLPAPKAKTTLAIAITASHVVRASARGPSTPSISSTRLEEETRISQGRRIRHAQLASSILIVLDELGYLPFARSGGQLLFHLVSKLYEGGPR